MEMENIVNDKTKLYCAISCIYRYVSQFFSSDVHWFYPYTL